ncbi:MAG TPA: tetratricopeptide repeat protein [Terriglobales bacterium]|nr:tetratricopeptide repeat protein [Terriglobales bacterium]
MRAARIGGGALAAALLLLPPLSAQSVQERLQLAQAAVQGRQWQRAEQLLAGARGGSIGEAAAILHLRGLAEAGLGRTQTAAGDLERAYELDPHGRFYAGDAGLALLRANAAEAASRALAAATQEEPGNARLWQALAVADLRMGRNRAAAAAAQRGLAAGSGGLAAELHLLAAQALGNDGQIDPALAEARAAAALAPALPNAHLAVGILLAERTPPDLDAAARQFQRAEALAPDFAPAYLQLGKLWLRRRRFADALSQLRRARQLAPGLEEANYLLAQALARRGHLAEAAKLMQEYERARSARRQQLANQALPTFIVE